MMGQAKQEVGYQFPALWYLLHGYNGPGLQAHRHFASHTAFISSSKIISCNCALQYSFLMSIVQKIFFDSQRLLKCSFFCFSNFQFCIYSTKVRFFHKKYNFEIVITSFLVFLLHSSQGLNIFKYVAFKMHTNFKDHLTLFYFILMSKYF